MGHIWAEIDQNLHSLFYFGFPGWSWSFTFKAPFYFPKSLWLESNDLLKSPRVFSLTKKYRICIVYKYLQDAQSASYSIPLCLLGRYFRSFRETVQNLQGHTRSPGCFIVNTSAFLRAYYPFYGIVKLNLQIDINLTLKVVYNNMR